MSLIEPLLTFSGLAWRDALFRPLPDQALGQHLDAALNWLAQAQDRCEDGGVSYGYSARGGWLGPYRETTGYIITTWLRAAQALQRPDLRERALRAARWLMTVQNPDGSFSNPKYGDQGIVFDTGQDLFGLVAAYEVSGDVAFLQAARRAGRWLVDVADEHRIWTRCEHLNTPHVYNTRTAWALLRLHQIDPQADQEAVARANLDWAVANQQSSGFFTNAAFVQGDAPYTHNISYTICGLQESAWILRDTRYSDAARRCSDAVLALMGDDGFVAGQINAEGQPVARYSCLTGQCQLAIVWAKQFQLLQDKRYQEASRRSLRYVMRRHVTHHRHPAIAGGVAGSFPVWGRYAPLSFPNWATKFFVDAALLQRAWGDGA